MTRTLCSLLLCLAAGVGVAAIADTTWEAIGITCVAGALVLAAHLGWDQ